MTSPVPPHYRAFRVALSVLLVTTAAVGTWWTAPDWLPVLRGFLGLP